MGRVVFFTNLIKKKQSKKKILKSISKNYLQLSYLDKLEVKFIEKSNVRAYIPFFNLVWLLALMAVIFVGCFNSVRNVFGFIPTTIIVCGLISVIPLMILEIMGKISAENIRLNLGNFVACLSRWLTVKEDLFFALEKAAESTKNPLKQYIKDACLQVKMGVSSDEALDMLAYKVDNDQFKDFVLNLKANIKSRGDVCKLVEVMENQFYEVQREYVRRKINTFSDKVLLYITAVSVIAIAFYLLTMVDGAKAFYIGTYLGKCIMMLFCAFFAIGTYLFSRIG